MPAINEALPAIYFDYSDLVAYFRHNRFPTGIQRVQMEFFKAALEWDSPVPVRSCTYSARANFWVDVDVVGLRRLCSLASQPGSHLDAEWQGTFAAFLDRTDSRPACVFPHGAAIVNVGASWWMDDYMPLIREAKARYGIRYIPLIYDLIPIVTPEFCGVDLVVAFSAWISSVFCHADLLAAISHCTQRDVVAAAKSIKPLTHEPVVVVPLDADFGYGHDDGAATGEVLIEGFGLRSGGYVLVVGTLEVRKNQMLIFQAWAKLIAKHGTASIPVLVLVGKLGHGNDAHENFLRAHPALQNRVVMLSGLSDVELNALYAGCLFTVFSSTYEGWGLPVTESLCHGRVCLSADHSSLPEAGGRFAVYFESGSAKSLAMQAETLIFDHAHRQAREALIRAEFRPRSWQAVLAGLIDGISAQCQTPRQPAPLVPDVAFGEIYELGQSLNLRRPSRRTALAEMLRYAGTWHAIEPWGSWSSQKHAKLAFTMPPLEGVDDVVVYCKLRMPTRKMALTVRVLGVTEVLTIPAMETRSLRLQIPFQAAAQAARLGLPVVLHLIQDDLAATSNSADSRLLGVGLESFALCRTGDTLARLRIIEHGSRMVALNALG